MKAQTLSPLRRIGFRLTLRVVLACVLFAALASVTSYRWIYAQVIHDNDDALHALAVAVQRTAAMGAYANDAALMQELADGLAGNRFVASVRIRSATQVVIGTRKGRGPESQPPGVEAPLVQPLMSPFDAKERVGDLVVEPDTNEMSVAASRQARAEVLLLVSMIGLMAVFLNIAAHRLVARPIRQLANELRHMVPGTDQRVTIPRGHADDEIGALVETANELLLSNQTVLMRERALRSDVEAMEAQYRRIFDSSSAGIFVMESNGRLINANPTVFRVMGLSEAEARATVGNESFIEHVFMHPDRVRALIAGAARTGDTASGDFELHSQGRSRWVHCLFSVQQPSAQREPGIVEGVLYDVTERRRAEDAALHDAVHDGLTGLVNRAGCTAAVAGWRPASPLLGDAQPFIVLFVDLDGFKQVNDRHGHSVGDAVLRACASRLRGAVRSADVVARIGGDEFVIVLRDVRPSDPAVCVVTQQVRNALLQPIVVDGYPEARLGVSIGIASCPMHGSGLEAVIEAADAVMYEVKRTGKNAFAMALSPGGLEVDPVRSPATALA